MHPPATTSRASFNRFCLGCYAAAATVVCLLASVLWLPGCSKSGPATFTPAITAPLPLAVVLVNAHQWVAADPANRYFATTADTHSMEPFFTAKSIPLCLRYTGQPVPNGTVAIFHRGDAPHVMHVISDQTADSVYMSGYNNRRSDGWFKKTTIQGIVVGQLYAP